VADMEQTGQGDEGPRTEAEAPATDVPARQVGQSAPAPAAGVLAERAFGSPRVLAEFARDFAGAASQLLDRSVAVRPAMSARRSVAEFLASLEEPTCCCCLEAGAADSPAPGAPSPGAGVPVAWIEISPSIAFTMIDLLLGSRQSGQYVPCRPLTDIERHVLRRIVHLAAGALAKVWPGPPAPGLAPSDRPLPRGPAGLEAPTTVATFELSLQGQVGTMRLCAPAAARPAGAGPPPAGSEEPAWPRPAETPLLVSVASEEAGITAEELAKLAPGDIVTTETSADGEVIVRVAGIPKFAARLGSCNGRRAITITRRLG